jgi:hypothetical protein
MSRVLDPEQIRSRISHSRSVSGLLTGESRSRPRACGAGGRRGGASSRARSPTRLRRRAPASGRSTIPAPLSRKPLAPARTALVSSSSSRAADSRTTRTPGAPIVIRCVAVTASISGNGRGDDDEGRTVVERQLDAFDRALGLGDHGETSVAAQRVRDRVARDRVGVDQDHPNPILGALGRLARRSGAGNFGVGTVQCKFDHRRAVWGQSPRGQAETPPTGRVYDNRPARTFRRGFTS